MMACYTDNYTDTASLDTDTYLGTGTHYYFACCESIDIHPVLNLPSKNWRWYHVFRTWLEPQYRIYKAVLIKRLFRVQEKRNQQQKRRNKR